MNTFDLLKLDKHALERSSQRGNFVDSEEFMNYLAYQASKKDAAIRVLPNAAEKAHCVSCGMKGR